jgi:glycosyltransferase involved in cell wall biosynthesis
MSMTLRKPEITVVIPVKNGARFVETAVRSVMAQTTSGLKLLLSDNDSADGTAEVLQKFDDGRNAILVRRRKGMSMLEHFNACLDMVQTEYYMLLCHDDYLIGSDALGKALNAMKANPELSVVYCDLEYVDQDGRHLANRSFGRTGRFDQNATARRSIISMRNQFGIPLLIRTKSVGTHRYDQSLPYVADVEMSLFLALAGDGFHLKEALIANRFHAANSSRTLHRGVRHQMKRLADNYSIKLAWHEIVSMSINSATMRIGKFIFFTYLALRQRFNRG